MRGSPAAEARPAIRPRAAAVGRPATDPAGAGCPQLGTLRALRRSKWSGRSLRFVWRNYRSHRTPIRYVLMKLLGEIEKPVRRLFARRNH